MTDLSILCILMAGSFFAIGIFIHEQDKINKKTALVLKEQVKFNRKAKQCIERLEDITVNHINPDLTEKARKEIIARWHENDCCGRFTI